jgi:hypothetical protein
MNIKDIQSRINEQAEIKARLAARELRISVTKSIDSMFGSCNNSITLRLDGRVFKCNSDYLICELIEAALPNAIANAQSRASADFLEKIDTLIKEIDDIQSQLS